MKMWRAMQGLVCGSTLMLAGTVAWGQATVQEVERFVRAILPCDSNRGDTRSSAVSGAFSESFSFADALNSVAASQESNVTPTSVTASVSAIAQLCANARSELFVRLFVSTTQRWRVTWNQSGSGPSGYSFALLQRLGSGEVLSGPSFDQVVVLDPGTYELYFEVGAFSSGNPERTSVTGNLSFTHIPDPTSKQVTYQGMLLDGGSAFTGPADVRFTFFDSPTGGSQLGNPIDSFSVPVQDGRFAVTLTPDAGTLDPTSAYAQIAVRSPGGTFVNLPGRTPLTAAAFAIRTTTVQRADLATSATTATSADFATSANTATNATSATSATNADHALQADHALAANSVPFAGITSNPWARSGSLLSTLQWVGIGKVPTDPLDVLGNIRLNDQNLYFRGGADINHGLGWHGTGKPFATLTPDGPVLFGYAGGAVGTKQGGDRMAMWWNAAGQVGINVSNTSGFTFAVGGVPAKTSGGSWATLSDPRAKKNITPMTGTLDRLMQLHGYEYTYRPEFVASGFALPGRQIGLLASEVQQVFPDWVERGSDGYLRVTERSTTALMVEALRDLCAEKDQTLKELREQVSRLEAAVKAQREAE